MSSHYVLKIQYVNKPPETRNITARVTTIGREAGDIVLGDAQSSGRHAEIHFENDQVRVKDLGSTNGTFFNGQRVPEFTMQPGQGFSIGQTVMTLMAVQAAGRQGAGKTMIAMGGVPPRPPGPPGAPPGAPPRPAGAPPGFGAPPPAQAAGFGAPPPAQPAGFGAPPPQGPPPGGFGAPPPQGPPPGAFGAPPPQGPPPGGAFGAPPPQGPPSGGAFGAPPPQGPPGGGFGPPPGGGFGAPPPQGPPPGGAFGAPPPQNPMAPMGAFGAPMGGPPMNPMTMGGPAPTELRGDFTGTGGELFGKMFVGALLTAITFGIYGFWFFCNFQNYIAEKSSLGPTDHGTLRFRFEATGGQFFKLCLVQGLLTAITFYIYMPWAICKFNRFFAENIVARADDGTEYRGRFDGQGGEFFVLMLVQGLLTGITFYIYMPWAICKVRQWSTSKYKILRNGAEVGGFGYDATGGQLFATAIVGALLTAITFYIYLPWFIVKLRKFHLEHTTIELEGRRYRGGFSGEGGELFVIGLVGALLMAVTLYIYYFWFYAKLTKWEMSNTVFRLEGGGAAAMPGAPMGGGMLAGGGGGYGQPAFGPPMGQPMGQPGYGAPPQQGYGAPPQY